MIFAPRIDTSTAAQSHSWDAPAEHDAAPDNSSQARPDDAPAATSGASFAGELPPVVAALLPPPDAESDPTAAAGKRAATAAPGAAAGTAAPAAPTASPQELAAIDLMLGDPLNQELIATYAPSATLPKTAVAVEAVKHYGVERALQMQQLAQATAAVREEYLKAVDQAGAASPPLPQAWTMDGWTKTDPGYSNVSFWTPAEGSKLRAEHPGWTIERTDEGKDGCYCKPTFNVDAFTASYAKGDSLAARAFAALYGSSETTTQRLCGDGGETVPVTTFGHGMFNLVPGKYVYGGRDSDEPRWQAGHLECNGAVRVVDLASPPELRNNRMVWFDPAMGFVTQRENVVVHEGWFEKALPAVFAAFITYMTAGAGAGLANSMSLTQGTISHAVVAGATNSMIGAALNGAMSGNLSFKNIFESALKGAITGGVTSGLGLNTLGMNASGQIVNYGEKLLAITGQATLSGALAALSGGDFSAALQGSFTAGIANGLAGQITGNMQAGINAQVKAGTLSAIEASMLRSLTQATGSAIRALANHGNPGQAAAKEFLQSIVGNAAKALPGVAPEMKKAA